MTERIVRFAIRRPRVVIWTVVGLSIFFGSQFPKIKTDTDPKHMLPATSPVRVNNDKVEERFELHADWIVLGIVNGSGVLNRNTLSKIARLTDDVTRIPGVIAYDVVSFTTADNVLAKGQDLYARPLMETVPATSGEIAALRSWLYENPMFVDRLISKDGKATAIYVPIEKTANGKVIADRIRAILDKDPKDGNGDRFYLAGDPVARDTFGAEMFKQMAVFSPIAGMVMFVALLLMFGTFIPVIACMAVAMVCVIWAMGGTVGLGIPIHIMSSMSPVFLMAISTDTVHIFNEFYFRFKETGDRESAILDTMRVVGRPLIYTDLTTAAAFASLAAGHIIPVRVFGLLVAFGTLVLLLMSFTLTPALLSLLKPERLRALTTHEDLAESRTSRWLAELARWSIYRSRSVAIVGVLLLIISLVGIQRIRVNNNMVEWFKSRSDVRVADRTINRKLGGTATAYLVAQADEEGAVKHPDILRRIEEMQRELEKSPLVGKTTSIVDVVKRINRVMHENDPKYEVIPDSDNVVAQYLLLFSMVGKPRDLNNFVDYPMRQANVWVQLKTWDAVAMHTVMKQVAGGTGVDDAISIKPAGTAYFNLVWNNEVLWGMLYGFILSCVLVLVLMALCFRSLRWGSVAALPLLFTILVIYGFVGFVGKDFDMPISVLSTLSLGLATDFAIHFIGRFRQRRAELGGNPPLDEVLVWTVARPGKGIVRNAILFALGFSVMIFAALTPYITVGLFMAAIMLLSALTTLVYLPALVKLWQGWLLKKDVAEGR
ncbi:MAG: MMPL family transporter [Armatimonadetes bacterium]|nr:MMPL family transporter [Armatimonadota bacterium]